MSGVQIGTASRCSRCKRFHAWREMHPDRALWGDLCLPCWQHETGESASDRS